MAEEQNREPVDQDASDAVEEAPRVPNDLVFYFDPQNPPEPPESQRSALFGMSCDWPIDATDRTFVVGSVPPNAYPGLTAFCVWGGARSYIKFHPAWDSPTLEPPEGGPLYEIRDVVGKGKGLFATRELPIGAAIVVEHPLIISSVVFPEPGDVNVDETGSGEATSEPALVEPEGEAGKEDKSRVRVNAEHFIGLALDRLSPKREDAFFALHNSKPDMHIAEGILRSNMLCFEMPGTQAGIGGVCEIISRANHSCVPNCEVVFNHLACTFQLHALRPIRPDQELTISYLCGGSPRFERQEELLRKGSVGVCDCLACTDPSVEARLEAVAKARDELVGLYPAAMRGGDALRRFRKLARAMYGEFGEKADEEVKVGDELVRRQVIGSWLIAETTAKQEPELAMEIAVEGRRLFARTGKGWSKDWRVFDTAVKTGCSPSRVLDVSVHERDWL